jgi:hypothetical protein
MARRADPERIFQARREAIRNTLTGSGMSLEAAERWCDAWELEATGRGLPRDANYWHDGATWIAAERAARRPGLVAGAAGPRRHVPVPTGNTVLERVSGRNPGAYIQRPEGH